MSSFVSSFESSLTFAVLNIDIFSVWNNSTKACPRYVKLCFSVEPRWSCSLTKFSVTVSDQFWTPAFLCEFVI